MEVAASQLRSCRASPRMMLTLYHRRLCSVGQSKGGVRGHHEPVNEQNKSSLIKKVRTVLSETSGESEISALKEKVNMASQKFDSATQAVTRIRTEAHQLQSKFESLQNEHMNLMMRRDSWTEYDIKRFATVTSEEIKIKRDLDAARSKLQKCEEEQELRQVEFMDAVRTRYHEEQIWQDKWRVVSTYGTWLLIGMNSILFLGGQYLNRVREDQRVQKLSAIVVDSLQIYDKHRIIKEQTDAVSENIVNNDKSLSGRGDSKSEGSQITSSEEDSSHNPGQDMECGDTKTLEGRTEVADVQRKEKVITNALVLQTMGYLEDGKRHLANFSEQFHIPSAIIGGAMMGFVLLISGKSR